MQPETPRSGRPRKVAFVTYTFAEPFAVGVFFRALRLAFELHRRGWRFVICNVGPIPDDPKVDRARALGGEMRRFGWEDADENRRAMVAMLREIDPDLVVFGEEPFPGMVPFFEGARTVSPPVVVLDQYYNQDVASRHRGVDRLLLYGLKAVWEGEVDCRGYWSVIPPFIDEVTPASALGAPASFQGLPWVTVLGFDTRVLKGGLSIIRQLEHHRPAVITVSHDPGMAERMMDEAGIGPERRLALPLQKDPDLFGWIAASRATILANGFMQMMEAVALGSPAITIDRGLGMQPGTLNEVFLPYVSHCEAPGQQLARLEGWLEGCPFPPELLQALERERSGTRVCADHLEDVAAHPRLDRRLWRAGSWLRWKLRGLTRARAQESESRMGHGHQ